MTTDSYDLALLGMLVLLDEIPMEEWGPHLAAIGVSTEDAMRGLEDMGQVIRDYRTVVDLLRYTRMRAGVADAQRVGIDHPTA